MIILNTEQNQYQMHIPRLETVVINIICINYDNWKKMCLHSVLTYACPVVSDISCWFLVFHTLLSFMV